MSGQANAQRAAECSQVIYDGFVRYNDNFHRITRRARVRFEQRDWKGHQKDIVARVDAYEKAVMGIVLDLRKILGPLVQDHGLWNDIRSYIGLRLEKVPDAGFIMTFYNSITRRIFGTVGIDPRLEFVASGLDDDIELVKSLNLNRYPCWDSVESVFDTILRDFSFQVPYSDIKDNASKIADSIEHYMQAEFDESVEYLRFEFIDSFFYQSARAYLVGRIVLQHSAMPIVIALKNDDEGIKVDAVLLSELQVSIVFGYTRSYYFADPKSVVGAVHFLHSLLPTKPIDELYTVLGRLRQGKTERYRIFTEHLDQTDEKLVHAEGDKGLVMIVFTLPSYNLVFKVMRDKFGYPKTVSRKEVVEKYKLVSKHDRAGRLIDTQEFLNLEIPIKRLSESLLNELREEAGNTTRIEGQNLLIEHVYVERRVRPLNLYLNDAQRDDAEQLFLDYGQAIKDLAQTNIFPGDLLLKNFGVTNYKRVVFYDYDEVALVTQCNFRDIPDTDDMDDELRADTWYYVAENDIFPEQFIKFLSVGEELRDVFQKVHGDLLTAAYWREIKARHLQGKVSPVVPYYTPSLSSERLRSEKSAQANP